MEQREFLRKQMLKKTREQIEEKFAGKEIHIIKAINLLSDLESINNLMGENVSEWKLRQPTGEAEKEFTNLEKNVKNINEQKEKLIEFIQKEMNTELPNFSTIATPIIGAKLLASSGSKKKLCFSPSSTIQVLGAEKALFNHIKNKARCPKHGHIFNHPLLQRLPKQKRGKAARIMAGKLSIALKQDYFNGENTSKEVVKELERIIEKISNEPEKVKKLNPTPQKNSSEHKTFTPEERRAFFEKQKKENNFYKNNYNNSKNNYQDNLNTNNKPKSQDSKTQREKTNGERDFKKFKKFNKFKKRY